MKRTLLTALAVLAIGIYIISCSKDKGSGTTTVDCSTVTHKEFTADINPIIQSTCNVVNCHAAGSNNGPGPLTNYTQVFNARSAIRSAIASGIMPQNGSLPVSQKNSIICWIDGGSPNN